MKLRANFRDLNLHNEQQHALLYGLIQNGHRSYLEEGLRTCNIPGRTRIYKAFGWSYSFNTDQESRDEKKERQMHHVRTILDNSDILWWVDSYCSQYTLRNFLDIVARVNINLDGFNIRVDRVRDGATV